ncbi:hypothetical protein N656DRAFT_780775 [Canariomyces notabilis]|uniref:Uncharacterized protein n=1 Tax=Canariomyces notabilis TaxID=2074819 RepID=A0AAN6TBV6_9PEZI|nr:hypothetical protein N656DRAFT_780775 [Canariomyces arenarius]
MSRLAGVVIWLGRSYPWRGGGSLHFAESGNRDKYQQDSSYIHSHALAHANWISIQRLATA